MRQCQHNGIRKEIEAYNQYYLSLWQLCQHVGCPWTEKRAVLQYITNLSSAFGSKKSQWQDVGHYYRQLPLIDVMNEITHQWNTLVSRQFLVQEEASGQYMDATLAGLMKEFDRRYSKISDSTSSQYSRTSHEPSMLPSQQMSQKPPCYSFSQSRKCRYGDTCRFSHDLSPPQARNYKCYHYSAN